MPTIAISVPSGSHHRALLQPLRDLFVAETGWNYVIISPGAPWADKIFPASIYPRNRFSFVEVKSDAWQAPETRAVLKTTYGQRAPSLLLTTTTGRDSLDRPILSVAKEVGIRTCTFIESWDNIHKMVRKRDEQVIPDHIIVWNPIMKNHLLREFPELVPDRVSVTGSPRLDYFHHTDKLPSREALFEYLNLDPQKRLLHLATVELYNISHVAEQIGEAKKNGDLPADFQLYASMHPGSGKPDLHKHWAEKYGYTLRYSFGRRDSAPHPDFRFNPTMEEMYLLVALWKQTDVMVNFSSTAAVESMLADRPTIGVMYGMLWDWWNWRRSAVVRDFKEHYADLVRGGGVRIVRRRGQLIPAINDYLAHPEKDREGRRRSCEIILTTLAGDASKKTFAVIKSLLESNE